MGRKETLGLRTTYISKRTTRSSFIQDKPANSETFFAEATAPLCKQDHIIYLIGLKGGP